MNRTEQNRTEQNRTEQNRTEQNRTDSMSYNEPLQQEICDFRWLFEHSPLATKIINLNGMSVDYNKSYFDLIGHAEIALKQFHPSATSPAKQPDGQDSFDKADEMIRLVKEKGSHVFEWLYQLPDGSEFYATVELDLIQFSGSPCIRVIVNNNSEKVKSQKLLIEAEGDLQILAKAMDQSMDSIMITDQDNTIMFINPAFTRITGYSEEEAIGQNPSILKSGVQNRAFYKSMWKDLRQGKPWNAKLVDRRKNGEFFPADLTITPVKNKAGDIVNFVGIKRDLTQHEALENKFRQAQKLEALGTMVGGIAHDFNNILAGITGNLFVAKQIARDTPDLVKKLNNIECLSFRAADMIQQMLTFSRKGLVNMQSLALNTILSDVLHLLQASIPANIYVQTDMCSNTLLIRGDPTLIHQIVMNLVNNACDAVEADAQPSIAVQSDRFQTDADFVDAHPYFKPGDYAHVSIQDNGCGISEACVKHIFEPFFTTKEAGKGTGLGLAMVYGAIKSHHGYIEVESISGHGCTFHLYFPLMNADETSQDTPATDTTQPIEGHGEAILVADDEQILREVTAEILEGLGYRVFEAKDGSEALALLQQHQNEIKLALLDVIMPHLGGVQLAQKIRDLGINIPILFVTGYDTSQVYRDGEQVIKNSKALSKPLQYDELHREMRMFLD